MAGFDPIAAQPAYAEKDTDELIRIAFFEPDFLPDAIDLARRELSSRGITGNDHDQVKRVENEVVEDRLDTERLASEPLGIGWKMWCFVFADIIALVVMIVKAADGKKRSSKEALKWFGLGWLFRLVIVVGFLVLG